MKSNLASLSTPPGFDFMAGQVFRETRPEAISITTDRIRQAYRGTDKKRAPVPERLYLRVLAVMSGCVVVISIEDPRAREEFVALDVASYYVDSGGWRLTDIEPMRVMRLTDEQLTLHQKRRREKNAELIQPLIDLDEDALQTKVRWPVIQAINAETGIKPEQIFRVFRRYLQGGMSTTALACNWYRRVGGVGRGARVSASEMLPRRRKAAGRPRLDGNKAFVVEALDVEKMVAGAKKYFFSGKTKGKWRQAWKLMVGDSYLELDCYKRVPTAKEMAAFPATSYPSYVQFRYWVETDDAFEANLKRLYGERKFQQWLRRRRHKTEAGAAGPGAVYIGDAWPLDWILVHQDTREPLKKKAVLYLIIDAFSHMIVGFYLHLGGEGFDPLSMALLSTAEDKVELCRRYGVEIAPEEWPVACLPTRLAEDGAGANYRHGSLVKNKVIRGLTIVPAYRPDLKGLVESINAAIAQKAKSLPGYSNGNSERGEVSPVALACLDVFETIRIIISWIRQTNKRIDEDYQLTTDMIADQVVPNPLAIWNWGCENLGGRRKKWPRETLLKMCLPTKKVLLTRDGIQCGPLHFEPKPGVLPKFADWCAQAAQSGSWEVTVSYRPDRYADVFLHHGTELVKLQPMPSSLKLSNWTEADYEAYTASSAKAKATHVSANQAHDIALEVEQHQIVENALKKTEAARGSVAQRKNARTDRDKATADQRHLIASGGIPASQPNAGGAVPTPLLDEDENEVARLMGADE